MALTYKPFSPLFLSLCFFRVWKVIFRLFFVDCLGKGSDSELTEKSHNTAGQRVLLLCGIVWRAVC